MGTSCTDLLDVPVVCTSFMYHLHVLVVWISCIFQLYALVVCTSVCTVICTIYLY